MAHSLENMRSIFQDRLRDLKAESKALDVTQRKDVKAFIECQKKFDCVNLIMNNAGFTLLSLIKALKVDEWDRMIDINTGGVLEIVRY